MDLNNISKLLVHRAKIKSNKYKQSVQYAVFQTVIAPLVS